MGYPQKKGYFWETEVYSHMNWSVSEMLFYGGLIAAITLLLLAAVYLHFSHQHSVKLNEQLDKEYGAEASAKQPKTSKRRKGNQNE